MFAFCLAVCFIGLKIIKILQPHPARKKIVNKPIARVSKLTHTCAKAKSFGRLSLTMCFAFVDKPIKKTPPKFMSGILSLKLKSTL